MTDRSFMSVERLRTGELAARAGVKVETLRYYERRGLLAEPERTPAGYRLYPGEAVRVVRFIKGAQQLGFSLREIEQLLRLRNDRVSPCEEVQALAEGKIETIEGKIQQLSALRDALRSLVRSCQREDADRLCPILEAMEDAAGDAGRGS